MKVLLKFFILIVSLITISCNHNDTLSSNNNDGKGSLFISEKRKSLGIIDKSDGKPISIPFILENKGEDSIIIKKLDVSCGCLTASVSNKVIMPNKSEKLIVMFNPKNQHGYFNKAVFINSTDNISPQVVRIKGEIR